MVEEATTPQAPEKQPLPRIGSKLWDWTRDRDADGEVHHFLNTPWGVYDIHEDCGTAVVTFDANDGDTQEIMSVDMYRFGTKISEGGWKLPKDRAKVAIACVRRMCELDARRWAKDFDAELRRYDNEAP